VLGVDVLQRGIVEDAVTSRGLGLELRKSRRRFSRNTAKGSVAAFDLAPCS